VQKITRFLDVVLKGSKWLLPFVAVGLIIPLLVLLGFGLIAVVERGYALAFFGLITLCTLVVYSVFYLWSRKHSGLVSADEHTELVEPSTDWSEFDRGVWDQLSEHIDELLDEDVQWNELLDHSIVLLQKTAALYGKSEYEFTVPESLKLIEEISRRYRFVLKENVPLIEKLKVSHFKYGFDQKSTLKKGTKAYHFAHNIYRVVRMANPISAAMAEARKVVVDEFIKKITVESQVRLKRALFQEVVSVSIDLYSGRFVVDDDDISTGEVVHLDQERTAVVLDALRIGFIGQVSSGKSSIINRLTNRLDAEVSLLPTTNEVTVHECIVENGRTLSLVDLPGLDSLKRTERLLVEQVQQCDLIIWVLKANQSSRALDVDFKNTLDALFNSDKNRSRKRPAVITVLNQVDLLKPVSEWLPPYDLENPIGSKATIIKQALEHNAEVLGVDRVIPLCVGEHKEGFNLTELEEIIEVRYGEGIQTQLNRRRREASQGIDVVEQLKRVGRAGQSIFKVLNTGSFHKEDHSN